jgi:hypothetical protein
MAARKRRRLALKTRERIRTSMLINRLEDHVFGRCEMTLTQVKAALSVLRETLPDLKPVKLVYEDALSNTYGIRASYHSSDAGKVAKADVEEKGH